jgi:hypothetical protein
LGVMNPIGVSTSFEIAYGRSVLLEART